MKKIFYIIFGATLLLSCDNNDDLPIKKDRGTIEVEYEGKNLKFGENSYNGIVRYNKLNGDIDTIGYVYRSRIWEGTNYSHYDDIIIFGYYNDLGIVDSLEIQYIPLRNNKGTAYNYSYPENPMVITNINYNPETSWLTANFEGYLYSGIYKEDNKIFLKNGKISVPMKGLEIPDTYY